MSTATQLARTGGDPYELVPEEVAEPPRTFFAIMRRIGPGMILAASIVGSGELIATTTLGAEVGYTALWIIILSCLVKPAIQSEIGRYVIATGETGGEGFNRVPGPRFGGVNWMMWAWVAMVITTFFQIGAMFGGVAQVLKLLLPGTPSSVWIFLLAGITLLLLLGGGYDRIEKLATIKVGLFTLLTFMSALMMMQRSENFSWEQINDGLKFNLPGAGLTTAIAVFGITGVGAAELFMYPYWCVEKGYARFTGKRDSSPQWESRARGWIRVMNVDILASMVVYCVATLAFYLLGAGILHTQGLVPSANDMIPVLSRMYTDTLGPWALWAFYAGAVATLYGTIFAATAGNCRVFADVARMMGKFDRHDYVARVKYRRRFIWFHTILPVILILAFQSPVSMVKAGGIAQSLMLPILAIGTLYLRYKRLPREAVGGIMSTIGLWTASLLIIVATVYYIIFLLRL